MNRIKALFDKTTPSTKKKNEILNNILNSDNKKINNHLLSNIFLMAMASACFMMMVSFNRQVPNVPQIIRTEDSQIIFEGVCYHEVGIWNGNVDLLQFIKETKEYIMGNKIYRLKTANSIIIQNEDNYIEFQKCEGE